MSQLSHPLVLYIIGQLLTHLVVRNKPLISTTGGRFPRAWLEPPRSLRSLWGLKAHGTALSFVPPKTFCYSRRTRKTATALHRTKKIDLYFRGVAAFRSNQRCSASDYE